jgi:hypothetical protein
MDKLHLTRQNLGRVFSCRSGLVHAMHLLCYGVKLPNLKLKTRPKQLLGSLPLDIVLSDLLQNFFKGLGPPYFLSTHPFSCKIGGYLAPPMVSLYQGILKGEVSLYH